MYCGCVWLYDTRYCSLCTLWHGNMLQFLLASVASASLELGWYGKVCYTGTSLYLPLLFEEIPYNYVAGPTRVTTCTWLSEFFCYSAITGSVIFNPEFARYRLSAGLCWDPLGELTALSRPFSWIWAESHSREGTQGDVKGNEGRGRELGSMPTLLPFQFQPCVALCYLHNLLLSK